jgi:hypothetical protein
LFSHLWSPVHRLLVHREDPPQALYIHSADPCLHEGTLRLFVGVSLLSLEAPSRQPRFDESVGLRWCSSCLLWPKATKPSLSGAYT